MAEASAKEAVAEKWGHRRPGVESVGYKKRLHCEELPTQCSRVVLYFKKLYHGEGFDARTFEGVL
jgi:hypothetical protein